QKVYESLHGLQMDTPRAQAGLVLMLTTFRKMLGEKLSAPVEAEELIDYTGIDPDAPIALGSWNAENMPDGIHSAERRAIVLRVKDRGRFERTVDDFQQNEAGFMKLVDILGIGSRVIAALPAVLPLTAKSAIAGDRQGSSEKVKTGRLVNY